ncbi:MAG: glycoside hydrolase family 3 protein, partial [Acholeplasmatales bacterium]
MKKLLGFILLLSVFTLSACTTLDDPPGHDDQDPHDNDNHNDNGLTEDFVETLLATLTLEEKVGQMLQAEEKYVTPQDVTQYNIGSILSGGGSHPHHYTDDVDVWYEMVSRYQTAALASSSQIPLLYGTDAVHGHNNVYGATIFPHNINLGMANDADLITRIGEATAREMKVTGIHWNFAPAVSVVEDIRWGRTYEGFSENVAIHQNLVRAYVEGLQAHDVLATAKHFVADGGTEGGQDQGNAIMSEEAVRAVHLPPFIEAIEGGVSAIMISYSALNGERMHGSHYWITEVLKEELGFAGIVLSDWNAIYQLHGDFYQQVVTAVNAGIDMLMLPYAWQAAHGILVDAANRGDVTIERIDDAVRRILRVKYAHNLFDDPFHRLDAETYFATDAHKELAREAAAKSFVLLENQGVLPLTGSEAVYLTGPAHHNIGYLSGGWTIHWQGTDAVYFGTGQTIYDAMKERIKDEAGQIVYSVGAADVVIVVFTEVPYTEWFGDTNQPALFGGLAHPGNQAAYQEALEAKSAGKTVIGVIASGRPL